MHKKGVPQPATRPKLLHIFTHRAQLQLTLGHLDHVFQQHGAGHRAYTAWIRRVYTELDDLGDLALDDLPS